MRTLFFLLMLVALGAFLKGLSGDTHGHRLAREAATAKGEEGPPRLTAWVSPAAIETGAIGGRTLDRPDSEAPPFETVPSEATAASEGWSAVAHPVGDKEPEAPAWSVSRTASPIDDSNNVVLRVASLDAVPSRHGSDTIRLELALRCLEGKTSLQVHFGNHLMMSARHGSLGDVTYRIDRKPAETEKWLHSNDHRALMLEGAGAIRFAQRLFGAKLLLIRATPYGESPVTVNFNVEGIEAATRPLRAACRW